VQERKKAIEEGKKRKDEEGSGSSRSREKRQGREAVCDVFLNGGRHPISYT